MLRDGLRHQGLHVAGARDVSAKEPSLAARIANRLRDALTCGGIDVIDDDARALGRQAQRNALTNAAAGAGDDDGFGGETHGGSLCNGL